MTDKTAKERFGGVRDNTETCTLLVKKEYKTTYNDQEKHCEGSVYKIREGPFFVWERIYWGYDKDGSPIIRNRFTNCSAKEAAEFMRTGNAEVMHDPFLASRPRKG